MNERFERPPGSFENPIVDSDLPPAEILKQNPELICPPEILERQSIIPVRYVSFDGLYHRGQLVVDHELAEDMVKVFDKIVAEGFPVHKVTPVAHHSIHWNDEIAMALNITSGFNYRFVKGKDKLSEHASGRAIDLNPLYNPFIDKEGIISPAGAVYDPKIPGTLTADHPIAKLLEKLGWEWGGSWLEEYGIFDPQHFEKPRK